MSDINETRKNAIVAGAKAICGERWQAPFSKITRVSQALLSKMVSDTDPRAVTHWVALKIAKAMLAEAKAMRLRAATVERLARVIKRTVE